MGWYKRLVVVFFSVILLSQVITFSQPLPEASAHHQQLIFTPGGGFFRTFDAIEPIIINGAIDFLPICFGSGDDSFSADSFFPTAFVYVIRTGDFGGLTSGDKLEDVSGEPNVVFGSSIGGAFFEQTIGFSNRLGEGTYAIVYDECQDKKLGNSSFPPTDDFVADPAFEILFKTDVKDLPNNSFSIVKSDASKKHLESIFQCKLLQAIFFAHDVIEAVVKPGKGASLAKFEKFLWGQAGKAIAKKLPVSDFLLTADPKQVAANICLQNGLKLKGLAADPPDPNFKELPPLENLESLNLLSNDQVQLVLIEYANNQMKEDALVTGLLSSVEKYQGAQNAQSGTWARIHATAIQEYSNLLMGQLTESNVALSQLENVITNEPDFDQTLADKEELRLRVQSLGITDEERRDFLNLGATEELITQFSDEFVARDFSHTKVSTLNFLQQEQNRNNNLISSLNDFSADIATIISDYEADPLVTIAPLADAGGPYLGTEDESIQFDGSGSSSSSEIILYEWDFDGDGKFDDANGPNPSASFNQEFSAFVGLMVTNEKRFSDVDYSLIEITSVNEPPVIVSFLPDDFIPEVRLGNVLEFSVVTSDPDGDNTNVQWEKDSEPVSIGEMFSYNPTNPDEVGPRIIIAVVTDDNPLGGKVVHVWNIMVLEADNDGDEWNNNTDCDDSNPDVNPGQDEVPGNGLDDDCNSETADFGAEPVADFEFFPTSPFIHNAALFTDKSTDDDGEIVEFHWDFGDGETSHDVNPMHMFREARDFAVSLQVTDNDGNTASLTKLIPIQENPPSNDKPDALDLPRPPTFTVGPGGFSSYGGQIASGDLNNDGFEDLITGDIQSFVDIIFGGPNEFGANGVVTLQPENGGSINPFIPFTFATGDVNEDEIDDLVIGRGRSGETAEINGAVSIYYGGDGSFDTTEDELFEIARIQSVPTPGPPRFGANVGVGDVNGDLLNDVIVGVSRAIYDPFPSEFFGLSGSFANPRKHGEFHIFLGGSPHNIITDSVSPSGRVTADIILQRDFIQEGYGPTELGGTGFATEGSIGDILVVDDISGDGIDDLIFGCIDCGDIASAFPPSNRNTRLDGKVMAFFGNTDASKIGNISQVTLENLFNRDTGENEDVTFTLSHYDLLLEKDDPAFRETEHFGSSIATGDINGDGALDLVVGSPSRQNPSSVLPDVRVYFGGSNPFDTVPDAVIFSSELNRMGSSVEVADFNGDGFGDVLVGTPEGLRRTNGFAQVFYGGPGEFDIIPDKHLLPSDVDGLFGQKVFSMNSDDDEFDEAVIGLPGARKVSLLKLSTSLETLQNTPLVIGLLGLDTDANQLGFFISQPPSHGTLNMVTSTGLDTADVTYTPNLGYVGPDNFSYKDHDSIGGSNLANVDINVLPDEQAVDENPPILVPPKDLIVDATAADGQLVDIGQATVMDDFDPNPDITNDAPALFPIGTTVVTWRATDVSGNVAEATQSITVQDDSPPQVEIVSPADGDQLNEGQAIEIQVDAQDNVKVQRVELFVDENKVGEDTVSPYSFPFVAPSLVPENSSPRTITFEARAFDFADQSSSASIDVRIIDVTGPPAPNLALPPDSSLFFAENPILAWRAVEDPSQPIQYTTELFNSDTSELIPLTRLGTLAARASDLLPDGNYRWQVIAGDSQGNASPFSSFFTFAIDTIFPPSTNLLSPPNGAVLVNTQPTLEWEDVNGADELFYLPRLERVDDSGIPIEIVSLSLTSAEPINVLPDGTYKWSVTVLDLAGNRVPSSEFEFTITSQQSPTIQDIINEVNQLVADGKLSSGRGNSIISSLSFAETSLDDGEDEQSILKLKSFISRINNFMKKGHLGQSDGQSLIDLTNQVINAI